MFESLSDRFDGIFRRLRSRGKLTPTDVDEVAREIRLALLEADVNVRVVKSFIARVKERATGAEVAESLSPGQQVIKIVHEELVATLGGAGAKLAVASKPPTVIVLAGLQGSGKTSTAAKLARLLEHQQGKRVLLVGADLQRPAAVEQLRVLGAQIDVPVFSASDAPVEVARAGIAEANRLGRNTVIIDTAGRLQVDDELMDELARVTSAVSPDDVLLVVDAMTGQEAVAVAEAFAAAVPVTGIVIAKLDGDARGGAALSVKEVTGLPILFAGIGEKIDDLEPFYPDRVASRILGMGDVLTLIEKAEAAFDADQAAKAHERLLEGKFTLEDFLDQMRQMKKMGPLSSVVGMLPGMPKELRQAEIDDGELVRVEAIICSMTPAERRDPSLINGSRRARIASGSGTSTAQVNALLKQFKMIQQMMRSMTRQGKRGKRGRRGGLQLPPGMTPDQLGSLSGMPGVPGGGPVR
jgi:signal recognition particle subunit SRP54